MSVEKTKALTREFVAIGLLHPNPDNPNEMDEKQFNLLSDNIEQVGITDPILVMHHPEVEGEYLIVGGQHRWEVAQLQGYTEVPVTLIEDPNFGEEQLAFQTVRHNIIGGKMNPAKFAKLYESLGGKYGEDAAAELFGFVDEDEFRKLLNKTQKSLPKEMQQTFKEAKKELKTLDDLAKLLNSLFSTHGDTLPQGYMFVDFGGYESVWLRQSTHDLNAFRAVAAKTKPEGRAMDDLMSKLLAHLASEAGAPLLESMMSQCPVRDFNESDKYGTLDFLAE